MAAATEDDHRHHGQGYVTVVTSVQMGGWSGPVVLRLIEERRGQQAALE